MGVQLANMGLLEDGLTWSQERAYRRQVREHHRHRVEREIAHEVTELNREVMEIFERSQRQLVAAQERIGEVVLNLQLGRGQGLDVDSRTQGFGEVFELRARGFDVLRRCRRFVDEALFGTWN